MTALSANPPYDPRPPPVDGAAKLGFDDRRDNTACKEALVFSHIMIGSNDIARSKTFYDSVFAATGGKPGTTDPKGRLLYAHRGGRFMVTKPIDGEDACHANGGTIGFTLESPAEVDAWHKAGVAAGGKSIEDPPGIRQGAAGQIYLAYLRDPDGNKLCAVHRIG
jgi:catechol 2,3-dioxygenase-like lactoylglutathione lyase family enzyme